MAGHDGTREKAHEGLHGGRGGFAPLKGARESCGRRVSAGSRRVRARLR
jgi:hypothetical protein